MRKSAAHGLYTSFALKKIAAFSFFSGHFTSAGYLHIALGYFYSRTFGRTAFAVCHNAYSAHVCVRNRP